MTLRVVIADDNWKYVGIEPGTHEFAGFDVQAREVQQKGGRAFGYRVTDGTTSVAYVPDALDANDDAILDLARDADLFVRGAPFVTAESERAEDYGHGTVQHAVEIAARARVRRLILTHHGPMRTDDQVAAIAAGAGVDAAYDGLVIDLG